MINIDMKINPSFYKKTSQAIIKKCEAATIKKTTLEAEKRCKEKSPGPGNQLPGTTYKASGNLRRGHSSEINDEQGLVKNNMNYSVYVIHGTSKMPARNYPQKVGNELSSEKYMSNTFESELRKQGVLD
jgi:hypothetical protein